MGRIAGIAQLVEQRFCNPQVPRSIRGAGTIWGCSSVGRAVALHASGRRFDSCHLHQTTACSAVWLAHLLWEQGVVGSNPTTPTIKLL